MIAKSIKIIKIFGVRYYFKLLIRFIKNNIKFCRYRISRDYKKGVNIYGYFRYAFGGAVASRSFIRMFMRTDIPFCLMDLEADNHHIIDEAEIRNLQPYMAHYPRYYRNLSLINAVELFPIYQANRHYFDGRYNISVVWWEYETGLEALLGDLAHLQEIIVFTDFIKRAVLDLELPNIKVTKLLYPFFTDEFLMNDQGNRESMKIRDKYRISQDDYLFLFSFDYLSSYNRKNPEYIIKAFSALRDEKNVKLFIKSINGDKFPDKVKALKKIMRHCGVDDKIIIEDVPFPRKDIITLLSAADCYISLHRGEGLGLGMLESMALGKPVIATRYGGNLEFMNDKNSLLVDYKLVPASDDYMVYKHVKYWADPDISHASKMMMKLYQDRDYSRDLGMKGRESINKLLGCQNLCVNGIDHSGTLSPK